MLMLSLPPPRTLRCLCRKPGALTSRGSWPGHRMAVGRTDRAGGPGLWWSCGWESISSLPRAGSRVPCGSQSRQAPCGSLLPGLGEREGLWGPFWGRHPLPSRLPWLVCDHAHPTPMGTLRGDLNKKSNGPDEVCQINGSVAWPVCCAAYSHNWILEPPPLLLG